MLVLCNSLVALVMLIVAVRGLGVLGGELRDLQLTFADDGSAVQLPPLRTLTLTPTPTLTLTLTPTLTLSPTRCSCRRWTTASRSTCTSAASTRMRRSSRA